MIVYTRQDGVEVEVGDWIVTSGLSEQDSDAGRVCSIEMAFEQTWMAQIGWQSGSVTYFDLEDECHYAVYTTRDDALAALDEEVES